MDNAIIPADELADRINKLIQEQAGLIGRVTIEWNHLCDMVFHTFWVLSGMERERARAIFYSLKSDSAQRDVTVALAKVELENDAPLLERILAVFTDAANLGGLRNAAVHTTWTVSVPDFKITSSPNAPVHRRLDPDDFEKQFVNLISELNALSLKLGMCCADFAAKKRMGQQ